MSIARAIEQGRVNVLVVDDDPLVTRMIRRALGPSFDVRECNDSIAALRALAGGQKPDVVLCDVRMPHCDGPQFLAHVRTTDAELAERIVFISGLSIDCELGAAAFLRQLPSSRRLQKPFTLAELRSAIMGVVNISIGS